MTKDRKDILSVKDENEPTCSLLPATVRQAIMGNLKNSPLPAVHPSTGEPLPFGDKDYYENLKDNDEVNFYIWTEIQNFLSEVTGMSLEELQTFDYTDTRKRNGLVKKIEDAIAARMPFLEQYTSLKQKKKELHKLGKTANDYFKHLLDEYLGVRDKDAVMWESSIINTNNIGSLAVKFLENLDDKMRGEAKLKLFLMIHLGIVANHEKPDVDFEEAMEFLMNLFNDKITYTDEGEKKGSTTTRYLISYHNKKDKKTTQTRLVSNLDDHQENPNTHVKIMEMRQAKVKNANGKERGILFFMDGREKTLFAKATKALRYEDEPENRDSDYNGFRYVFESIDDLRDFEDLLLTKIKREYTDELIHLYTLALRRNDTEECESLQEQITNANNCIEIVEDSVKDSLSGSFEGTSNASSKNFNVRKYRLVYHHPNGKKMHYEFQFMLFDGFMDDQFRHDVNSKEYHTKRAFKDNEGNKFINSVIELVAPHILHPSFDIKKAYAEKVADIRLSISRLLDPQRPENDALADLITTILTHPEFNIQNLLQDVPDMVRNNVRKLLGRLNRRQPALVPDDKPKKKLSSKKNKKKKVRYNSPSGS